MEFTLLGIEWDKKPFRNRADKAPKILRNFFEHAEVFDHESGINLEDHLIRDLGDIKPTSYEDMLRKVNEKLNNNKGFPIILGGDHSISFSSVNAIKPKTFVSLDAHPDCEPLDWCYWSVTRQIAESGIKSYLYGIRCISKNEWDYIKSGKVKIATIEKLKDLKNVYLSVDFDVLDPSIMPAGGYPEPNGLSFNEVLNVIKTLSKNIVAVDFVEFVPDNSDTSPYIAVNLIYKTLIEIIKARS